jgi:Bacterial sugar transferase
VGNLLFSTSNQRMGLALPVRFDRCIGPQGAIVDALPEVFDVILEHTSLVAPRPSLSHEAVMYAEHVRWTLPVKRNLTGTRQVNGRSDLS